jgi:hypothetical protein
MKSLILNTLNAAPFYAVYEGEGDSIVAGGGNDTVISSGGEDDLPPSAKDKKTFTQDEFNKALAEDRKKHQARVEKAVKELETLQKSKTLTEKEKTSLQARIDDLQNSMLTEKQIAQKEKEKLETTHKQTVQSLTADRDAWQNRFINSQINQAIISEAVKAEAFDPEDLIARLKPDTRLIEEKDDEGKSLESYTPKVKFLDSDNEGKSITLELTVEQTIKRMKEMPKFAHLFKSTAVGGTGTNNGTGKGAQVDISKMSPEQYMEWRKKKGFARKAQ